MRHISFLHCADIHLGHLQYNEPQRLQDFADSFGRLVDYALDKQVDFILISGDFFHKRAIDAQTLQQAIELLSPLKKAGIPVIAIEGNHDKAFYQDRKSWLAFLNNQEYLFLLTPFFQDGKLVLLPWDQASRTGSWLELGGVRIYGAGYLGVTTAVRLEEALSQLKSKSEQYTVFMLHAAVNKLLMQELGGVKSELLEPFRQRVDYLALGHIHSRYEMDGWIYNPGSLECVHLDEFGPGKEKGFYHVTIGGQRQEVRYVPSSCRSVCLYTVDLSKSGEAGDVYELIYREVSANKPSAGAQVQVRLVGDVSYNPLSLDLNNLMGRLKDDFYCLYVEILNYINLPAAGSLEKGVLVKREDVERHVFGQILLKEKGWDCGELEEAVEVVRKVKEMALGGEAEEEMIKLLLHYGERLIKEDTKEERTETGEAV